MVKFAKSSSTSERAKRSLSKLKDPQNQWLTFYSQKDPSTTEQELLMTIWEGSSFTQPLGTIY